MTYSKKSSGCSKKIAILLIVAIVGFIAADIVIHNLFPQMYCDCIEQSCEEFGVDQSLVYAVIHTESGFDPKAQSQVGAMGLMQIMPETFDWLQSKLPAEEKMPAEALYQPEVNIRYGVFFLSLLKAQFGSDTLAVAAYHAGQGSVSSWLSGNVVSSDCCAEDIPSAATGYYVSKVERARRIYRKLYF